MRKFYGVIFFLILLLMSTHNTQANQANFGYQFFHFNYSEPNIEESGILHGLKGDLRFQNLGPVELIFDSYLSGGGLDYDGRTISPNPRSVSTETDDLLVNFEPRIALPSLFKNERFVPNAGLGYRYWQNDIKDASGVAGFEREIQYIYLPIGFQYESPLIGRWSSVFELEGRLLLTGQVNSKLSDASDICQTGSLKDVKNTQDNGKGVNLEYKLNRKTKFGNNFNIEFFLSFWDIDRSDIVNSNRDVDNEDGDFDCTDDNDGVFEPENETLQTGARLMFTF